MQGSSSRSTTTDGEDGNGSNSTGGAEVGKNYENSVKEILLVLTKADWISHCQSTSGCGT